MTSPTANYRETYHDPHLVWHGTAPSTPAGDLPPIEAAPRYVLDRRMDLPANRMIAPLRIFRFRILTTIDVAALPGRATTAMSRRTFTVIGRDFAAAERVVLAASPPLSRVAERTDVGQASPTTLYRAPVIPSTGYVDQVRGDLALARRASLRAARRYLREAAKSTRL